MLCLPRKELADYDIDDDVDWAKSRLWTRGGSCQHVTIVCAGMFSNHLIPSQNRVLQIMVVVNGDDDDLISKSRLRNENCGEW